MLDNKGFDLWADSYDKSVGLSEESDSYPFAGYKKVLGSIYSAVRQRDRARVLDIGFGTGVLTKRLYDKGYSIFGIDFSEKMLNIARKKMPAAVLRQHDFSAGLPQCFVKERFDFIICTYAIHHLTDEQKVSFIRELLSHLMPGGKLLIGDVAFETTEDQAACRALGPEDEWDEDEIYMIAEKFYPHFPAMRFEKSSHCAGVFTFEN